MALYDKLKTKKPFSLLIIVLALSFCVLPFARAETWVTNYSFYLPNSYGTFVSENFTCNYENWRIAYSFGIPDSGAWLTVTVYNAITNMSIDEFRTGYQWRNLQWSGTHTIGGVGTFYMVIKAENLYLYPSIEAQEDIDSIPEFPSFLILSLFMMTTLLAVIIYSKKHSFK
jgi:hypothetical protein